MVWGCCSVEVRGWMDGFGEGNGDFSGLPANTVLKTLLLYSKSGNFILEHRAAQMAAPQ